jgi:hypothetical protein
VAGEKRGRNEMSETKTKRKEKENLRLLDMFRRQKMVPERLELSAFALLDIPWGDY